MANPRQHIFALRVDLSLWEEIRRSSKREFQSINQYINEVLDHHCFDEIRAQKKAEAEEDLQIMTF